MAVTVYTAPTSATQLHYHPLPVFHADMSGLRFGLLGKQYAIQKSYLHRLSLPYHLSHDFGWAQHSESERAEYISAVPSIHTHHAGQCDLGQRLCRVGEKTCF